MTSKAAEKAVYSFNEIAPFKDVRQELHACYPQFLWNFPSAHDPQRGDNGHQQAHPQPEPGSARRFPHIASSYPHPLWATRFPASDTQVSMVLQEHDQKVGPARSCNSMCAGPRRPRGTRPTHEHYAATPRAISTPLSDLRQAAEPGVGARTEAGNHHRDLRVSRRASLGDPLAGLGDRHKLSDSAPWELWQDVGSLLSCHAADRTPAVRHPLENA